jgi:purine-nucleoside phosphorylase
MPCRETEAAISRARDRGALAVEMEAAALYAFSAATRHPVVCFAHVTNAMALTEGGLRKR